MSPLRPIVLVPGACLGGWAWDDVAARLRAAGHPVHPVTLTGLGDRAGEATPQVDLDTHVADVVDLLDGEDLRDVVLVGHSYAGVVVTGAADRRPQRLDAVVWCDASPLPDGTAVADAMPPEVRAAQEAAVRERGGGWRWPGPDRATLETGAFGSVAGLTDADFDRLARRGTPQPWATFTTPVRLTGGGRPRRRVAILCIDGGVTVELLRALLAQGDPRAQPFAGDDWELHELPTGHWPMWSALDALADLLARIAAA